MLSDNGDPLNGIIHCRLLLLCVLSVYFEGHQAKGLGHGLVTVLEALKLF
jgi:hypothetical protein